MVLIADPRVLAIDIIDNQESMVNVRDIPSIITDDSYYFDCLNIRTHKHSYVRETVSELLVKAQENMPNGWNIKLTEGHRSEHIQKLAFDMIYEQRRKEFPELSDEQVFLKTTETVSPIFNLDGSKNVPPHSVGGAVDVKIVDDSGVEIDLGKFPEDDLSLDPITFRTYSTLVSKEQQERRKTLCSVMESVGFVNYPFEWWHYSYGDRYWAFMKGKSNALYDYVASV